MLLTKTVMLKWTGKIKSYYINKGYFFTKMGETFEVKVEDLSNGSGVLVDIKCDNCNKEIKDQIFQNYKKCLHKNGEYYCSKCSTKLFGIDAFKKTNLNKSISFYDWCYKNLSKEEADAIISRWDYSINKCSPKDITYSSTGFNKKGYWFKCTKHINHKSELKSIINFTKGQKGSMNCNQCLSFAQYIIDLYGDTSLELYWDFENNNKLGINPWKINKCANKSKIYIKCQNSEKKYHGSYLISCNKFTSSVHRCPYCSKTSGKVHPKDSLGQYIIDNYEMDFLNKIWSDKNEKSPFGYAPNSGKIVWWKCIDNKHEDFKRSIDSSNKADFRCSSCTQERIESVLQQKVRLYLEETNYTILHEYNCTIVPQNPKTKFYLPFDNEIKELKLVVEVHGIQHYKIQSRYNTWVRDKTPEEYLHYQQLKDRYKRICAIQKGYNYIEIPYWTDDKEETWKQLIDNKINEILNLKEVI